MIKQLYKENAVHLPTVFFLFHFSKNKTKQPYLNFILSHKMHNNFQNTHHQLSLIHVHINNININNIQLPKSRREELFKMLIQVFDCFHALIVTTTFMSSSKTFTLNCLCCRDAKALASDWWRSYLQFDCRCCSGFKNICKLLSNNGKYNIYH